MEIAALTVQANVSRTFIQLTPVPWARIVVNLEIEEDAEGYRTDCLAFAVVPDGSGYVEREIRLDRPERDTVFALHAALGGQRGSWYSVAQLRPGDRAGRRLRV